MESLRNYLAGLGLGGLLIAAAAVVFLGVAGVLGFGSLPGHSDDAGSRETVVQSVRGPESASRGGTRPGSAGDRRPRSPPAGGDSRGDRSGARSDGGDGAGAGGSSDGVPPAPPTEPPPADPGPAPDPPPPPSAPEPPEPAPPPPADDGELGGIIDGLDETIGGVAGLDPGLGELTQPFVDPLDETVDAVTGGAGTGLDRLLP